MSELEEAWTSIKEYVTILMEENPTPGNFNLEFAQRKASVIHRVGKVRQDIDLFLESAPASDSRREAVLHLKNTMENVNRPD